MRKQNHLFLYVVALLALIPLACKKKKDTVTSSTSNTIATATLITSSTDTLQGSMKGTLTSGKTYYLNGNLTIPDKDSLIVENGVTVYALGNYAIYIRGTLDSKGTKGSPVAFTVTDAVKKQANYGLPSGYGGAWGGLNCDSATSVTLNWTRVEYMGGPDPTGSARLGISCKYTKHLDIEDSWIRFTADDGLRIHGTQDCIIRRNTFEHCGGTGGGESINIKQGASGDISYNIFWNSATKSIKLETDATVLYPQTSFNIYNNTVLNSGFRNKDKPGFGTSIDLNTRANIFNNLYINCLRSIGIFTGADTTDSHWDYDYFFSTDVNVDSSGDPGAPYFDKPLRDYYYANDNGLFHYDEYPKFSAHDDTIPVVPVAQQAVVVKMNNYTTDVPMLDWFGGTAPYDVTPASNSPVLGKGQTSLPSGWSTYVDGTSSGGQTSGTINPNPGKDVGAKQSDGTGNQH